MARVLFSVPLSYALLPEGLRSESTFSVHDAQPPGRPYRVSSTARAEPAVHTPAPGDPIDVPTPRVRLHLRPGQNGTKQLLAQYGDRLVCVRYRHDPQRRKRLKTVELIVAQRDWDPPRPRFTHDQVVGLRVAFVEAEVREQVKQAGGKWNPEMKVWQLRYDRVIELGFGRRIVDRPASSHRYPRASGEHRDAGTKTRST